VAVVGLYTLGAGFIADGALIASDETFRRVVNGHPLEEISVGLLRVAPGADPARVARELSERLPKDVAGGPRQGLLDYEREYWRVGTSIGIIFGTGVAVGFTVLTVIVYQLVSTDIAHRMREYATMKALGYGETAIFGVVVRQALTLVVVAVTGGFAAAVVLYGGLVEATHLPIRMTAARALGVFVTTVGLSAVAAFLALRRLRAADPADLFA
jgi:putative ABC transport system permease protein